MPSLSPSFPVESGLAEPSNLDQAGSVDLPGVIARARTAVDAYVGDPANLQSAQGAREAIRCAAERLAARGGATLPGDVLVNVRELLVAVWSSGLHDAPVTEADLSLARLLAKHGPAGWLAAMLCVAAWQWPDAPSIAAVPAALTGDYVRWFLAPPQAFAAVGQAELYPARYLQRLEDLLQYARTPGVAGTKDALLSFINRGYCVPLYFCANSLRRHYEIRAQLLRCAMARPPVELAPRPRTGRPLRVGFINRHFGPQTETYTTLPMFEQLDPERFEVLLFTTSEDFSAVENHARRHAARFTVLPGDAGAQIDALRAAELDVAVFGTNVTAIFNDITRLALHRVAPLQVVNNSSCTTTGLPEIDLYVSGTLTEAPEAPEHFSERLGLVAGPAHAFNYEADREEATGAWTREMLGLPEGAVVFVTAANFFKIIPEMQHAWAKLLAAVPGSRLLVHPFNPNWSSSYPIKRFAAELDRVLEAHGVGTDRLVISSIKFPSRTDVKELLRVGDLYLDTYPFGGVNSLVDPLELGIPPVVWEGSTFRARMGGALLRSLGLDELIATDEVGYLALATRLATDAAARDAVKTRITDAMGRAPVFLDPLAASDAFGAVLETAYDELLAVGRAAFRSRRTPIRATGPDDPMMAVHEGVARLEGDDLSGAAAAAQRVLGSFPAFPAARHLLAAVLLRRGRAVRAVDYLLGAVQHVDGDAPLWHDLAVALQESGRTSQALQALETSLRIDSNRREGWKMFAELARLAGNADLEQQALQVLGTISPDETAAGIPDRAPPVSDPLASRHVLVYTDDPQHGGVAQYNHALLLALAASGQRATCVQTASDSPLAQQQRAAGVRHVFLDYDTGRDFRRTLEDGSAARRIFEAERPDLIVFSDCSPVSNFAAREVARKSGIPYVVVVGFVGSYLAKNFAAYLPALAEQYRAARAVVAVSQENLDLLRRQFGLPTDAGQVIHYGRPAEFFTPRNESVRARLRAELGLPADAVLCFTAARLTGVKGFGYQLQAAARLGEMAAGRPVHFVWAGEGEQRGEIERETAHLGLTDRVHLIGQRWDVADWYDAADIFVLPSHLEGMPLAIMEAMAKGLPVIATAVSGIPEELGATGKLLPDPAKDPAGVIRGLIETISAWAADAGLRARLGAAARARAEAMFREELMTGRTLCLLAECCPASVR
jgi:glycosyltransferase involved in cell wall biosynthesis